MKFLAYIAKGITGLALIVTVVALVYLPFFFIVWKEKQLKTVSMEQEQLKRSLVDLKSRRASLEVAIEQLSTSERLERYAVDTLNMIQPDPMDIVMVQRDKDGVIIVEGRGVKAFLQKLMRRR